MCALGIYVMHVCDPGMWICACEPIQVSAEVSVCMCAEYMCVCLHACSHSCTYLSVREGLNLCICVIPSVCMCVQGPVHIQVCNSLCMFCVMAHACVCMHNLYIHVIVCVFMCTYNMCNKPCIHVHTVCIIYSMCL